MNKFIVFISLVGLVTWIVIVRSHYYLAAPVAGKVVDADTGRPVEGAVALVIWNSQSPQFHTSKREVYEIEESKTNSEGVFTVPGWPSRYLDRFPGSFASDQPEIYVYKYGYELLRKENFIDKYVNGSAVQEHQKIIRWYGKKEFFLKPIHDGLLGRVNYFEGPTIFPIFYSGCLWKKSLNFILEIDKQKQEMENYYAQKKDRSLSVIDNESLTYPWYLRSRASLGVECQEIVGIIGEQRKLRVNEENESKKNSFQ